MRNIVYSTLVGVGILLLCLIVAMAISQPQANAQLRNAYWPFSVETVVSDN